MGHGADGSTRKHVLSVVVETGISPEEIGNLKQRYPDSVSGEYPTVFIYSSGFSRMPPGTPYQEKRPVYDHNGSVEFRLPGGTYVVDVVTRSQSGSGVVDLHSDMEIEIKLKQRTNGDRLRL